MQRRHRHGSNHQRDSVGHDDEDDDGDKKDEIPNFALSSPSPPSGTRAITKSSAIPQSQRRRKKTRSRRMGDVVLGVSADIGLISLIIFVAITLSYLVTIYYVLYPIHTNQDSRPPRLPVANVDVPVPNAMDWPIVHIVNTRFMQEQGPLVTLGMARFHLFMTFCFPTMISQSSQKFFWIIKTDPQFTTTPVFDLLLDAVNNSTRDNIYVVSSNKNFLVQPNLSIGTWKDGAECKDLLQSKVYTGNMTRLYMAMALRNERPVLETRLDADDGLHMHYMGYMQLVALKRFQPELYEKLKRRKTLIMKDADTQIDVSELQFPPAPQWLYWCTRRHLEWHAAVTSKNMSAGILVPVRHERLCVTPGMTLGFNVGVDPLDVPQHSHDLLYKQVSNSTACYQQESLAINKDMETSPCLDLVEDLLFCALRSRTLTSAGMLKVDHVPVMKAYWNVSGALWTLLHDRFHISKSKAQETKAFLLKYRKEIAMENILGQCTTGHSCKDRAKAELQQIIDEEQNKQ